MSENLGLSADERGELERLRAENAALRAQAGQEGPAGPVVFQALRARNSAPSSKEMRATPAT